MKYALLFSGQPIFYDSCYETLHKFLPKNSNSNHFAHLWWDKSYRGKCNKMHFSQKYPDVNDVDLDFCDKYKVDNHISEPHLKFDLSFQKKINLDMFGQQPLKYYKMMTPIVLYSYLSQSYSMYQSYKMAIEKDDYDVFIRTRPDIVYTRDIISIIEKLDLKDDQLYFQSSMDGNHVHGGGGPNKPCDWFFVGNKVAMGNFLYEWHSSIKTLCENGLVSNMDIKVCDNNNLKINLIDFATFMYKQINDFYTKFLVKSDYYMQHFHEQTSEPIDTENWPHWVDKIDFKRFGNVECLIKE